MVGLGKANEAEGNREREKWMHLVDLLSRDPFAGQVSARLELDDATLAKPRPRRHSVALAADDRGRRR